MVVLLALILCLCLAGCGGNKETVLTIGVYSGSYWNTPNGNCYQILDEAITLFEESHPGVNVEYVSGIPAGSYSEWLAEQIAEGNKELLRPNGLVLSYPVITSGDFAHRGSFDMLIGEAADTERRERLLEELSLEKQVTEDTPPTFIWHTYEDGAVPAENSLLFVQALRRKNIPVEFHLYPKGGHGLGLGTELTCSSSGKEIRPEINTWIHMAETFIRNL